MGSVVNWRLVEQRKRSVVRDKTGFDESSNHQCDAAGATCASDLFAVAVQTPLKVPELTTWHRFGQLRRAHILNRHDLVLFEQLNDFFVLTFGVKGRIDESQPLFLLFAAAPTNIGVHARFLFVIERRQVLNATVDNVCGARSLAPCLNYIVSFFSSTSSQIVVI